jgi:hypothetical protein
VTGNPVRQKLPCDFAPQAFIVSPVNYTMPPLPSFSMMR